MSLLLTLGAQSGANGENTTYGIVEELVTLSTAGATTDSTANLLPADSIIIAVTARITTSIAGINSTSIQIGDANVATRFGSAAAFTTGTVITGINQLKGAVTTDNAGPTQTAAAKVRITLAGGADNTPSAGAVRIAVHYITITPPTA